VAFTRKKFGLFWSVAPSAQDISNLELSNVKLVMLPLSLAVHRSDVLTYLSGRQCKVIIRIDEPLMDSVPVRELRDAVRGVLGVVSLEAVQLGNEPEHMHDLRFGSPSWGIDRARHHKHVLASVRDAVRSLNVRCISPGWTAGRKHELDDLKPGMIAWRIEVGEEYGKCQGNSGHVYLHEWRHWRDELRFLYQVNELAELWHLPLWLDEVGVTDGTDVEQMQAYLKMGDMLLNPAWPAHHRVECFIPFVSNGTPGNPPAWNPKYLLQDPEAYRLLGTWVRA